MKLEYENEHLLRVAHDLVMVRALAEFAVVAEQLLDMFPDHLIDQIEDYAEWIEEDIDERFDLDLGDPSTFITQFLRMLRPGTSFWVQVKPI